MIADTEFMKRFVRENNIDCELGANEVNTEKFLVWFNEVKELETNGIKVEKFDVVSVVELFEQDLEEFTEHLR